MWTFTRAMLSKLAGRLATPAGSDSVALSAFRLGLLKAAYAPTVDSTYGDVSASIADYTGYGAQTIGATTSPFIGPGDLTYIQGTTKTFQPTDALNPNTIYAGILLGAGAESVTLFGVEVLDEPVVLPNASYELTYLPRFGFDPAGNWGLSIASP